MEEHPTPSPLEYFSPHEPERRRARGVVLWSIVLLLSWVPYLCGVVNASTVAMSYVPEITSAHRNASILAFAMGLGLSATSLTWFARNRHWAGAIAATGVFAMQVALVVCLGVTSW